MASVVPVIDSRETEARTQPALKKREGGPQLPGTHAEAIELLVTTAAAVGITRPDPAKFPKYFRERVPARAFVDLFSSVAAASGFGAGLFDDCPELLDVKSLRRASMAASAAGKEKSAAKSVKGADEENTKVEFFTRVSVCVDVFLGSATGSWDVELICASGSGRASAVGVLHALQLLVAVALAGKDCKEGGDAAKERNAAAVARGKDRSLLESDPAKKKGAAAQPAPSKATKAAVVGSGGRSGSGAAAAPVTAPVVQPAAVLAQAEALELEAGGRRNATHSLGRALFLEATDAEATTDYLAMSSRRSGRPPSASPTKTASPPQGGITMTTTTTTTMTMTVAAQRAASRWRQAVAAQQSSYVGVLEPNGDSSATHYSLVGPSGFFEASFAAACAASEPDNDDWLSVMQDCKARGRRFKDKTFPPDNRSLYRDKNKPRRGGSGAGGNNRMGEGGRDLGDHVHSWRRVSDIFRAAQTLLFSFSEPEEAGAAVECCGFGGDGEGEGDGDASPLPPSSPEQQAAFAAATKAALELVSGGFSTLAPAGRDGDDGGRSGDSSSSFGDGCTIGDDDHHDHHEAVLRERGGALGQWFINYDPFRKHAERLFPLAFTGCSKAAVVGREHMAGSAPTLKVLVTAEFGPRTGRPCLFATDDDAEFLVGAGDVCRQGVLSDRYLISGLSVLSGNLPSTLAAFPPAPLRCLRPENDYGSMDDGEASILAVNDGEASTLADSVTTTTPLTTAQSWNDEGCYAVRLNCCGAWRVVVVDDYLPCGADGRPCFAQLPNSPCQFWPLLVEKAFAKLYGSYEAIQGGGAGGHEDEALQDLTGGVPVLHVVGPARNDDETSPWCGAEGAARLWRYLNARLDEGSHLHAVRRQQAYEGSGRSGNVVHNHAYGVLRFEEVSLDVEGSAAATADRRRTGGSRAAGQQLQRQRLVQIRNPWTPGYAWDGAFGDSDPRWHDGSIRAEDRVRLGRGGSPAEEGSGGNWWWMPFSAFLDNFDELSVCRAMPPQRFQRHHVRGCWSGDTAAGPRNAHLLPTFHLTVERDCHVVVELQQPSNRHEKSSSSPLASPSASTSSLSSSFSFSTSYMPIAPIIGGDADRHGNVLLEPRLGRSAFVPKRSSVVELDVCAGKFSISPAAAEAGHEGVFYLDVYTSAPSSLEALSTNDFPLDPVTGEILKHPIVSLDAPIKATVVNDGENNNNNDDDDDDDDDGGKEAQWRGDQTVAMDEQKRRKKDIKKKVFVMQKNLAAYRKAVAEKCALCGEPVGLHIDGGEASQKTFYNSTGGRIHAECYLQQLLAGFRSPTPAGYNRSSAYHGGAKAKSRSPEDTTRVWGAGSTACCPAALGGHSGYILAVACSPDSAVVASASSDKTVRLFSVNSCACLATLTGHTGAVKALAFSNDSRMLLTGSKDRTGKLWSVASGVCLDSYEAHEGEINAVAFSPDGKTLATASNDSTTRLWNKETGLSVATLEGHSGRVYSVDFSADGRRVATGARDKTARIWRIKNGVCVARNVLEGHSGNILIVKFSPDSATLATASNDKTVKIWSVVDGALRATLSEHSGWVSSVVFSPNGAQLATGSQDATAKIWDSERGRCVATLKGHSNWINDISFSPDGKAMITGSEDCSARLWNLRTSTCVAKLDGHSAPVRAVAFTPDGKAIVTGSKDTTSLLWKEVRREAVVQSREPWRQKGRVPGEGGIEEALTARKLGVEAPPSAEYRQSIADWVARQGE